MINSEIIIQRMIKEKQCKLKENEQIYMDNNYTLNFMFCNYCHHYMHTEEDCLEKKIDEEQKEYIIQRSNIPKKYWKYSDPLKAFLMNNTIHGYCNRINWEKTHPNIYYKIENI